MVKTDSAIIFLQENPDLNLEVARAEDKLKNYFADAPLYLDADDEHLMLLVATDGEPKDVLDTLHSFDSEWFNETHSDKLTVDVCAV